MTDGRRRHYGQFYGLDPVPDGPVGFVHGNCQAEALRVLLEAADPVGTWVRVPPVHELTAEDLPHLEALLARTTRVVAQPIRDDYRDLPVGTAQVVARAGAAPAGGGPSQPGGPVRTVIVPVVRYLGLHPLLRLVRGGHLPDPPVVPYAHLAAIARAAGLPEPVLDAERVRRVASDSMTELRRRQELAGAVPVDDLLLAAGGRATNTVNHPGNPVLLGLAERVAERLDLTGAVSDPGRELLRSVYAPLTAGTLEALGLDPAPTATPHPGLEGPDGGARDHWQVGDRVVTDEEVVTEQARWWRANPRWLATALEKTSGDLALLGSHTPATRPVHVVVGPPRHGVVLHARRIAKAVDEPTASAPSSDDDVTVHFTDRAFGDSPAAAADAFEQLAAGARTVQVVLHDVPQASDGTGEAARTQAYTRVCAAADAVVVSSEHERGLLARATGMPADRIGVVPLPVERSAGVGAGAVVPPSAPDAAPSTAVVPPGRWVATLGFLYPGKGVEEVIRATARAARLATQDDVSGQPVGVLNLGGAAPGHEDMVEELEALARAEGIRFVATGWLSDEDLLAACRQVAVPVAYHRHVSASGSVNSWLTAGRRPLVATSPYAREQADRLPGCLTRVEHADDLEPLVQAITDALDHAVGSGPATGGGPDAASTHLPPDADLWPSWEQAARMLGRLR